MFRALFVLLAVLALSVSASSSSSSAFPSKLSSSSSYVPSNSSTGSVWYAATSSSSSSSGFPSDTYSISFEYDFAYQITTANINQTAQTVQQDIAYNIAVLSNANNNTVAQSVLLTSINGTRTPSAGASRRLLQAATAYPGGVTFILLGSIVNALPSFNPTTAVTAFVQAAAAGTLVAKFTNATIPVQTIQASPVGAVSSSSSSSSTGYGDGNGASSAASASVALLFAAVASLALLL